MLEVTGLITQNLKEEIPPDQKLQEKISGLEKRLEMKEAAIIEVEEKIRAEQVENS